PAAGVVDRDRHGAHAVFELLVDQAVALPGHVLELRAKTLTGGDRLRGALLQVGVAQVLLPLAVRKLGEQNPPHRRAVRGQPRADGQPDRHDPRRGRARDVDDVLTVEYRGAAGLVHALRELLEVALRDLRDGERGQVRVAEVEQAGPKVELPAVG